MILPGRGSVENPVQTKIAVVGCRFGLRERFLMSDCREGWSYLLRLVRDKKEQTFNHLHQHKLLQMIWRHQSSVKICLQICITQAISGPISWIDLEHHSYNFFNFSWVTFCCPQLWIRGNLVCFLGKNNNIWNLTPLCCLHMILYIAGCDA